MSDINRKALKVLHAHYGHFEVGRIPEITVFDYEDERKEPVKEIQVREPDEITPYFFCIVRFETQPDVLVFNPEVIELEEKIEGI